MACRRPWRLGGGARHYAGALRLVERDLGFPIAPADYGEAPRQATWLETVWNELATREPNSSGNTAALRVVSDDGECGRVSPKWRKR